MNKSPKLLALLIVGLTIACVAGIMTFKYYTGEDYLYQKCLKAFDNGQWQEVIDTYNKIEWEDKYGNQRCVDVLMRVAESYYHLGQYDEGKRAVDDAVNVGREGGPVSRWLAYHQLYGDMPGIIPTDLYSASRYFIHCNDADVMQAMAVFFEKQDWKAMNNMGLVNQGYRLYVLLHKPEYKINSFDLRRDLIFRDLLECRLVPEFALEYGDAALIDMSDMPLGERLDKAENAYRMALAAYPARKDELETRLKYVDMLRKDMNINPEKVALDTWEQAYLLENYSFHIGRRSDAHIWHYSPGSLPEDGAVGIIGSFEGSEENRNVYIGRIKTTWNSGTYQPLIADSCLKFEINPYKGIYNVTEVDGKTINWRNKK